MDMFIARCKHFGVEKIMHFFLQFTANFCSVYRYLYVRYLVALTASIPTYCFSGCCKQLVDHQSCCPGQRSVETHYFILVLKIFHAVRV